MSDIDRNNIASFFASPNTIPNVADELGCSRDRVARHVKALVADGALVDTGEKEDRDGQGRKGQRPRLYKAA